MGDIKGEETQTLCSRKGASMGRDSAYQKGVILFLCVPHWRAHCVKTTGSNLWNEVPQIVEGSPITPRSRGFCASWEERSHISGKKTLFHYHHYVISPQSPEAQI